MAIKIKKKYQGRQKDTHRDFINESIRADKILVIAPDGEKLGVMSKKQALDKADEHQLDLILISNKGAITVAKIYDYGKFKYERKKKESENKKNQKATETKEIRLRPNIDVHDIDVKIKNARKFIAAGNKLKVSLSCRGREMANKEVGMETINRFIESLEDIAKIDKAPKMDGRFLNAMLSPINKK